MDLRAWREKQEQGEQLELGSGLVVRARRVGLLDLVEQGQIDAPLLGMVDELLNRDNFRVPLEEFKDYAPVFNRIAEAVLVDPPVAQEADDEHLAVTELPVSDRMQLFRWANEPGSRLKSFRPESE